MTSLNLTAAKRIHIVEPQWNPAVESQAVGRIVRIGQESSTTVVRYHVAGAIEEVCWTQTVFLCGC
jgi:SWI/SNF-related matrix-associated actin-dependent regulator of chromatin subfamily A3